MRAAQNKTLALYVSLHDFKEFAHFMVGLLLAAFDVSKAEERLSTAKSTGKLGQDCMIIDRENAGSMKRACEALNVKNDMYENAVDIQPFIMKIGF